MSVGDTSIVAGPETAGSMVPGPGPEREFTVEARGQARLVTRRFLRHRLAVVSMIVLVLVVFLSLVGGRLWKYSYSDITEEFSTPPSLDHPFGTNGVGNDVFAQVLRGAQKSVQIMLLVAGVSTLLGVVIGAIAGYYRGPLDWLLMRLVDLLLIIPLLAVLGVLAELSVRQGSWVILVVVLGALVWTSLARIVRAEFLSLREKEFVEAARALGAKDKRIIFKHILPNCIGSIIVSATLTMATAILLETALSYLGRGVQPPDTSLGKLVAEGQTAARTRWWLFYSPGVFIIIIVLCVNFIGDGLRDAFDPKQTRVRQ
jgi:ABC-type dipeptide/oligopeptide/nickel transport system permease subunit